jgi:hypothetical protein
MGRHFWRSDIAQQNRSGTMAPGFEKTAIDLTSENWEEVEKFNACLERLLSRRKSEINISGPLTEPKTAWKCAVLQQALLYRATMLALGCADAWNDNNIACSMLAARALLETIVLCNFICDETKKFVAAGDIDAIEKLANEQLFSTKVRSRLHRRCFPDRLQQGDEERAAGLRRGLP